MFNLTVIGIKWKESVKTTGCCLIRAFTLIIIERSSLEIDKACCGMDRVGERGETNSKQWKQRIKIRKGREGKCREGGNPFA